MIKFRTADDGKIKVFRWNPEAPAGSKNEPLGSFLASRKRVPSRILDKMTADDLRDLVHRMPYAPLVRPPRTTTAA
jgi:hypothetical protein